MRKNHDAAQYLYQRWTAERLLWTRWTKPVVFMGITDEQPGAFSQLKKAPWAKYRRRRAVIVDLPGEKSVEAGLTAALSGYCPVLLFNGVNGGSSSIVPMRNLVQSVVDGAYAFDKNRIADDANPVFLLDGKRLTKIKRKSGKFDNRWCVVPQDFPSANLLLEHGIREILVQTDKVRRDLEYVLYQFQKAGITIMFCNHRGGISTVKISNPQRWKLFYRFFVLLGFNRNAAGGFGMSIPEISSGGEKYRVG